MPAPQRAARRSYRFHFLGIERLGPQTSRFVVSEEGSDGQTRLVSALRTPRAFAWEDAWPGLSGEPLTAALPRSAATNDHLFELWLGFLDTVYHRTGTAG